MLNKKKILSFIYFLLALLPLVSAQPLSMPGGVGSMIENFFRSFFDLIGRQMVLAGIVFIAFFTIQYSIFVAAAKKIKIFSGDGGINNQGIAFAVALSALSTLGIFYSMRENLFVTVERILTFGSTLGIFLLATTVFLLVYYKSNLKEKRNVWLAVVAAGITIIIMSYLVDPSWSIIGAIIALIGAIGLIAQAFGLFKDLSLGGGGSKGGKSGGSKGGKGGVPKEKYTDVQVHVTDSAGNNISGAQVKVKHRYRGWKKKGVTDPNGICNFRFKSGSRSIKALHNGEEGIGKFNLIPNQINKCPIIIGAGPEGSGRIYGTVRDSKTNLQIGNVNIKWNGISTKSNHLGHYVLNIPKSSFGKSKITAKSYLYIDYESTKIKINDSKNINFDIDMDPISSIPVEIKYDYGKGPVPYLITNQKNVIVKIKSLSGDFTNGSYNRFILYDDKGKEKRFDEKSGLNIIDKQNYEIKNVDTTNCNYCKYFFK